MSFGCTGSSLLCEGFLVAASGGCCPVLRPPHRGGFSCWGTRALGTWALVVVVHRLVAPQHVGSSLTRDQTHVSYIGRWTVIHWTTREVLFNLFKPCIHVCVLSLQFFATLWTVTRQSPLSIGFSRQGYWGGLPCPLPGDLTQGSNLSFLWLLPYRQILYQITELPKKPLFKPYLL